MTHTPQESAGNVWVCLVCGYVHRGNTPPEACPVCGASASDFERQADSPSVSASVSGEWHCLICGYVHAGDVPPDACPVCGASADEFERPANVATVQMNVQTGSRRILIIGGGIAGITAAESARDACPNATITIVSKESSLPYYRLNLTRYLAGEVRAEQLPVHPESWYAERDIRLLLGETAAAIEPEGHMVRLESGAAEPFDKLILACGAHAFIPPIEGVDLDGVTCLRTRDDADGILDVVQPGTSWIVIGGGILGLETAGALAQRGLRITVIENFDWLLPRQLDKPAAERLHAFVAAKDIELRYQGKTQAIEGEGKVRGIRLADGEFLPADGVIIAAGVRPNSHLARKAGIEVNQGVVVDAHLTTSHPDILAVGDVAEHRGIVYGLWEPARYQGSIAGLNAAGIPTEFAGLPRANTLKVLGIDLFSIGTTTPSDGSFTVLREEIDGNYYAFLFRDNALAGAILVGNTHLSAALAKSIKTHHDCSALLRGNARAKDAIAFFGEV